MPAPGAGGRVELGVVAGLAVDLGWRGIRDESGLTVPSCALRAVLDHVLESALVAGSVVAVHAVERVLILLPGLPVVGMQGLPPVGVGAYVAVPAGLRAPGRRRRDADVVGAVRVGAVRAGERERAHLAVGARGFGRDTLVEAPDRHPACRRSHLDARVRVAKPAGHRPHGGPGCVWSEPRYRPCQRGSRPSVKAAWNSA